MRQKFSLLLTSCWYSLASGDRLREQGPWDEADVTTAMLRQLGEMVCVVYDQQSPVSRRAKRDSLSKRTILQFFDQSTGTALGRPIDLLDDDAIDAGGRDIDVLDVLRMGNQILVVTGLEQIVLSATGDVG